ncbi:MAG: histidine kinase [Polyangiaceae bacterium UTPRO1]|jgi:CBS domain-containing protein|nr:CBS domain-containing protein [Myxococcales bacterium]OQY69107.1 MAG: histidine kinase [Polyangiaceae bacterium UTPRO1]
MATTVYDVLQRKGAGVIAVGPESTVFEALQTFAENNIGAVLVLDDDCLVGILSERDYARQVILKGKASKDTPVREIMTTAVVCVHPEHTIEECMALMTDKRFRHLPVIADDRLIGVLSIGDVVKALLDEQAFRIEQLEMYIASGG